MACRSWSVSRLVRFLPMPSFYGVLDAMSSIFTISEPIAVWIGRRPAPEQACWLVAWWGRIIVSVYGVYVYRTIAFSRVRGGFVDCRRRGQHKHSRRPTALGSRRHVSPASPPRLGQFV